MAKFLIFFVLLFSFNLALAQEPAPPPPTPPDPPSAPTNPADRAEAIELSPDSTLILNWEPVTGAAEYYFQYWQDGTTTISTASTSISQSEPILATSTFSPGAKYFWHVKSCADDNCGNWSDDWSFTYLLNPPSLGAADTTGFPVKLRWDGVNGAQSYGALFFLPGLLGKQCHPFLYNSETKECEPWILDKNPTDFADDLCFFSKNNTYKWQLSSCLEESGTSSSCGQPSPLKTFSVGNNSQLETATPTAPFYSAGPPEEIIPPVNQSSQLSWSGGFCAYSYRIEIKKGGALVSLIKTTDNYYPLKDVAGLWSKPENFGQIYSWRVVACWDQEGNQCETSKWSSPWFFQTTGAPPVNLQADVKAVVSLSWSWGQVPDVASYRYQAAANQNFSSPVDLTAISPAAELKYPQIQPNTVYWWRVKACADAEGKFCGHWSEIKTFTTLTLSPPTDLQLGGGGGNISWPRYLEWKSSPAALYTKYNFSLLGQEIAGGITSDNFAPLSLNRPGEYRAIAFSCLDVDCTKASDPTPTQTFRVAKPECPASLVPCGRACDVEATPYDEMKPCQFKHLGFGLQNILDFMMWRVGLILFAIMAIITGVTSYFSFGSPAAISRIKALWRSAGLGYAMIFLAWTIINVILRLLGFQVEFFGRWWQLPF